jgi:hypothetical protein
VSSLVVLDVDVGKGGFETLSGLENECGKLPETTSQATGGGGRHYLFRWPEIAIRSNAGVLGSGLDIRGRGGFIVAPPSPHISGRVYAWGTDFRVSVIAPVPPWMIERLTKPVESKSVLASGVTGKGERNVFLTSLGGKLRAEGKTRQEIKMQLAEANAIQCYPPLNPAEVDRIAASVSLYRKGPGPSDPRFQYRDWLKSPDGPPDAMTCHILRTITDYMDKHGRHCFPNIIDIAKVSKCGEKTVRRHLNMAAEKGWIGRYAYQVNGAGRKSYGYYVPSEVIRPLPVNESLASGHSDHLIDQ